MDQQILTWPLAIPYRFVEGVKVTQLIIVKVFKVLQWPAQKDWNARDIRL